MGKWYASVCHSRATESLCGDAPQPSPQPSPSDKCDWHADTGFIGADMASAVVKTKEECCGLCKDTSGCVSADFNSAFAVRLGVPNPNGVHVDNMDDDLNPVVGYKCHLKSSFSPKTRKDGSIACVPKSLLTV